MKLIRGDRISEDNIQGEFYAACKIHNINCYLEYSVPSISKPNKKHGKCRFDAVIYDDFDNIRIIIEIKSYKEASKKPNLNTSNNCIIIKNLVSQSCL